MNFNIVDGKRVDFNEIYDDFVEDYIFSTELSNLELRKKYGLTYSEFKELSEMAKAEHNIERRPIHIRGSKYYYKHRKGYSIYKTINGKGNHIAYVKSEKAAIEIVERCKKVSWDIPLCRQIAKELKRTCLT